jgi:segregation and condensation protein B
MLTAEAQKIEALLFLAGESVSVNELARLIDRTPVQTQPFIDEASRSLEGHGICIIKAEEMVQISTSPAVAEYLKQYVKEEAQELSAAAAETLAIVAYRGPISRVEIDAIRGVDSRRMLRQLYARDLVRKTGEAHAPKYAISEQFLHKMGVRHVSELPEYDNLSSHEKVQQLLDEKLRN